jgi:glycosyltransferase involved in cell wall biosynthesis
MLEVLHFTARAVFPVRFGGGAERATHALLQSLVKRGVRCRSHGCANDVEWGHLPSNTRLRELGVRAARADGPRLELDVGYIASVSRQAIEPALMDAIARHRPTHVWAHLEGALDIVKIAVREGLTALWYIHDVEQEKNPSSGLREAASLGATFVACSPFVAARAKESAGVDATVIYPAVDPEQYVTARPSPEFVTMINPNVQKGFETFLEFAALLPDVKFLLVEGWPLGPKRLEEKRRQLVGLDNVEFIRAVADIREVFRRTKLLVVPSIWEEAFCRVVLEAHASGIPVIASRRGGLADFPEGVVFVDDYRSPEKWREVITELLSAPERMAELSKAALRNARSDVYSMTNAADRFYELLARTAPRRDAPARVEPAWIPLAELDDGVADLVCSP